MEIGGNKKMKDTAASLIDIFIDKAEECVVSSIGIDGHPQGATVGFSVQEDYKIVFGTFMESRKYKNLIKDGRISVTIGFSGTETIQYQGRARVIEGEELEARLQKHFKKIPEAKKYRGFPGQVYFVIEPTWIRYANLSGRPWTVKEINFS
jgi:hypothetical protein